MDAADEGAKMKLDSPSIRFTPRWSDHVNKNRRVSMLLRKLTPLGIIFKKIAIFFSWDR